MATADIIFSKQQEVHASGFATKGLDISTARKLFGGYNRKARLVLEVTAISGITSTLTAQLFASDTTANSAGDLIATITCPTLTAAAANGLVLETTVAMQPTSREFYNVYLTFGGASSATVNCYITEAAQLNLTK